jgi:hypothetical protein
MDASFRKVGVTNNSDREVGISRDRGFVNPPPVKGCRLGAIPRDSIELEFLLSPRNPIKKREPDRPIWISTV